MEKARLRSPTHLDGKRVFQPNVRPQRKSCKGYESGAWLQSLTPLNDFFKQFWSPCDVVAKQNVSVAPVFLSNITLINGNWSCSDASFGSFGQNFLYRSFSQICDNLKVFNTT